MDVEVEDASYAAHPRFDPARLGRAVDLLRAAPIFQYLPGLHDGDADAACAGLLNKLSDLRWPCCINGCPHQCVICSVAARPRVRRMAVADYHFLIAGLKALKEAAGLRFSFGLYDVAPHQDGDTLMYFGRDGRGQPAYSAYEILRALTDAGLFQTPEKPGRNRLQIFTSGFYDPAGSRTVTDGARRIVRDADVILGRDPATGETGRIVFSFSNAARYLHGGRKLAEWWRERLVQMFSILRPLADTGRLGLSIKHAPAGTGNEFLEKMTIDRILAFAEAILRAAGFPRPGRMLEDANVAQIQRIYAQGRASDLPVGFSLKEYVAAQYPPEFSALRLGTRREGMIRVDGSYVLSPIKPLQPENDGQATVFRLWLPAQNRGCLHSS